MMFSKSGALLGLLAISDHAATSELANRIEISEEAAPSLSPSMPSAIELEAKFESRESQHFAVPCLDGRLDAKVYVVRKTGPSFGDDIAVASVGLRSSVSGVYVSAYFSPEHGSSFALTNDAAAEGFHGIPFSIIRPRIGSERISIAWNRLGATEGAVGGMETHEAQLLSQPTDIVFAVASAKARFTDIQLVCSPDSNTVSHG